MCRFFFSRRGFYLLLLLAVVIGIYRYWGIPFHSAYRRYTWWAKQTHALEQKISILRLQVAQKKHFIRKLMIDHDFREYVSHEQLKYLKDNEYVIFFKQKEAIR